MHKFPIPIAHDISPATTQIEGIADGLPSSSLGLVLASPVQEGDFALLSANGARSWGRTPRFGPRFWIRFRTACKMRTNRRGTGCLLSSSAFRGTPDLCCRRCGHHGPGDSHVERSRNDLFSRRRRVRRLGVDSRWALDDAESRQASRSGGMADAPDSKSGPRKGVWVQVPPSVLSTYVESQRAELPAKVTNW